MSAGDVVTISVAAERWEPYEARVSRTVLRGPGGEVPLGYSLNARAKGLSLRTLLVVSRVGVLRIVQSSGRPASTASHTHGDGGALEISAAIPKTEPRCHYRGQGSGQVEVRSGSRFARQCCAWQSEVVVSGGFNAFALRVA